MSPRVARSDQEADDARLLAQFAQYSGVVLLGLALGFGVRWWVGLIVFALGLILAGALAEAE